MNVGGHNRLAGCAPRPAGETVVATRPFDVVIEQDEDGWLVARVPELPGCHLKPRVKTNSWPASRRAIILYFEQKGDVLPRNRFIGVQHVEAPA